MEPQRQGFPDRPHTPQMTRRNDAFTAFRVDACSFLRFPDPLVWSFGILFVFWIFTTQFRLQWRMNWNFMPPCGTRRQSARTPDMTPFRDSAFLSTENWRLVPLTSTLISFPKLLFPAWDEKVYLRLDIFSFYFHCYRFWQVKTLLPLKYS